MEELKDKDRNHINRERRRIRKEQANIQAKQLELARLAKILNAGFKALIIPK